MAAGRRVCVEERRTGNGSGYTVKIHRFGLGQQDDKRDYKQTNRSPSLSLPSGRAAR